MPMLRSAAAVIARLPRPDHPLRLMRAGIASRWTLLPLRDVGMALLADAHEVGRIEEQVMIAPMPDYMMYVPRNRPTAAAQGALPQESIPKPLPPLRAVQGGMGLGLVRSQPPPAPQHGWRIRIIEPLAAAAFGGGDQPRHYSIGLASVL